MVKKRTLQSRHGDTILDFRQQQQVLKFIALITLVFFVPLGIKNLLIGEVLLGAVLLAFEITLLLEIAAIIYNKAGLFGHLIPLALLVTSTIMAVNIFGTLATYWVFPIIISIVFLLPARIAMIANIVVCLGSTIAVLPHQELSETSRYAFSLLATAVIVHVVVKAVRQLQKELRYLSVRDPMTGAYNRHQLQSSLENIHQLYNTSSIALIDIDKFKATNDLYGHDVGDQVITEVVGIIDSQTEHSTLLFRLGGDEFLLLFPQADQYAVESSMQAINRAVKEHAYPQHAKVTLSVGVAESKPLETIEDWVKRADIALYQSKSLGRDRVSLYSQPDLVDNQSQSRYQRAIR
ncbi:diguanylate cyclase [Vibrio neptunius]|uniref:GGDEF domain-containing protein n=1 Tax=Vibrio neptunius TaxID=170651 RepID=UPI0005F9AB45|nr:GGDEF domain-containing protein [Vibrio neptunius]KJY86520.1 diguanylate cyclase [Vibrio neptunius]